MNIMNLAPIAMIRIILVSAVCLIIAACGGGGSGGTTPPSLPPPVTLYTIGGTVSGLSGIVTLRDNGGDDLQVAANGEFHFATQLPVGSKYAVTVQSSPSTQTCQVTPGTGSATVTGNVTHVAIVCTINLPNSYAVGGTISNASDQVELTNTLTPNAGAPEVLQGLSNGHFTFHAIPTGVSYKITVTKTPAGQTCTVNHDSGTIGTLLIDNVAVDCALSAPNTYRVGGTIKNLLGAITLKNTSGTQVETLTMSATQTSDVPFQFNNGIAGGCSYRVEVVPPPPTNQTCDVSPNGTSNAIMGNVNDVIVTCTTTSSATTYSLSATVTGLVNNSDNTPSTGVVIRNRGGSDTTVTANSVIPLGSFDVGTPYALTLGTQPSYPAHNCTITGSSGSGTPLTTDAITVQITCTPLSPIADLRADVDVTLAHKVKLNWTIPPSTPSIPSPLHFNAYASTVRGCDFRNNSFVNCPGQKYEDVSQGATISSFEDFSGNASLKNGQAYFFQVETSYSNGAKGVSNLAMARPNQLAFNGPIKAIAPAANGNVYLGGAFTAVGVATGSALPLDSSTGRIALDFPAIAGTVNAVLSDGADGWYVGGAFTAVGGVACQNLAHIRANGSVDTSFNRWRPDGAVNALARFEFTQNNTRFNTVYIGGTFNKFTRTIDSFEQTRNHVAAIDPSGELTNWHPNPSNEVNALAVLGSNIVGNKLYVGGRFTPSLVAFALDSNGLPSNNSESSFQTDGAVNALTAHGFTLYVGGQFTHVGAQQAVNVARIDLNAAGVPTVSATFLPNPGSNDTGNSNVAVLALSQDGGTLYVAGAFHGVRFDTNVLHSNLAAIRTDGNGAASPWNPDFDGNGVVKALAVSGDTLYVGGKFSTIGSNHLHPSNLAAVEADPNGTASARDFHPDLNNSVNALAVSGGILYAAGEFNGAGSRGRTQLAAIDATGSLLPWAPSTTKNIALTADTRAIVGGDINAIAAYGGKVFVGGSFGCVGGTCLTDDPIGLRINNLAAFDADNGSASTHDIFFGEPDGPVNALAVLESTGSLYVGGSFSTIGATNGVNRRNLAALFLNGGTLREDFNAGLNSTVNTLLATHDANAGLDVVYAGGGFTNTNSGSSRGLAKLNADLGTAVGGFNFVAATDNGSPIVKSLAISAVNSSTIYVAGTFTSIRIRSNFDSLINPRLAAVDTVSGFAFQEFSPVPDGEVQAVAAFGAFSAYAGGSFLNSGGISDHPFFAFLDGGGHADGTCARANGPVSVIVVSGETTYLGGTFTDVGAIPAGNFATISSGGCGLQR